MHNVMDHTSVKKNVPSIITGLHLDPLKQSGNKV